MQNPGILSKAMVMCGPESYTPGEIPTMLLARTEMKVWKWDSKEHKLGRIKRPSQKFAN